MEHRNLGRSGLQVSRLSLGSWVTFNTQLDNDKALEAMQAAWDAGVTFFDNAEAYAGGKAEEIMGKAFRDLGWDRDTYTVSTKFYWGVKDGPNTRNTLNRKYLMSAIDQSLERFQLDTVDVVFCHRADPDTPIEETVFAMSDMITQGKAYYWGTSEWAADEIRAAWEIAERHHLHKPIVEQPQYHMLHRTRVEHEYARLYEDLGLGLTTWSPLASGMLTGKYLDGIPAGSRAALPGYEWLAAQLTDEADNARVRRIMAIADDLGCSSAQLAIAWAASNPRVSTVITGASSADQVRHNLAAIDVIERLDEDVQDRIEAALAG